MTFIRATTIGWDMADFLKKNVCFEMYDVIASALFTQWRHSVASLIVIVISQFYEETATWNLAWLLRYYFFTIIAEFREAILFFGHSVINIDRRQVRSWVMVYIHQAEHFPSKKVVFFDSTYFQLQVRSLVHLLTETNLEIFLHHGSLL